ncbi:MAG: biotin--[acetyl-CoA-carboxylase] ligase [Spirochaetota bacterium]|nr:biotin--[acetyl-CoA-carboxylase] ligase [Spirochaetota bacterium]
MSSFKPILRTEYFGKKLLHFTKLKSTNAYLLNDYEGPFQEGVTVIADHQTMGRGRLSRSWFSYPSKSLLFSILLTPNTNTSNLPQLTQVFSLAIAKTLEQLTHLNPLIKWPNDIYINGRKICGILSETRFEDDHIMQKIDGKIIPFVVMGIGINVNEAKSDFPDELKNIATSLAIETDKIYNRENLFANILYESELYYNKWKNTLYHEILEEINIRFYLANKHVKVIISDNTVVEGKVKGLSPQGYLLIKDSSGYINEIISGDVNVISN